jgi:phosphomevalonate kinase
LRVAFSGKRLSGKTTAAKVLNEFGFLRVNFASPLKQEVADAFRVDVMDVYLNKERYRQALQERGEARRKADSAYWINRFDQHLKASYFDPDDHFVLDDLRYQNEAQWLRKNGWKLIRIEVSPHILQQRRAEKLGEDYDISPDLHISELDLDYWTDWDYVIHNDYSLDIFRTDVKETFASLLLDEVTDERNKWDLGINRCER